MVNKKAIPIGISDFKMIIDKGYYYVDKTIMIKDILDNMAYVNLFTRPRRFGKTLNLSMLKYFFEKTEENNSYLFEGLNIWESGEKYREHQGKYPVINLDFKSVEGLSWKEAYEKIRLMISNEYARHEYLLGGEILSEDEKDLYNRLKSLNFEASATEYIYSIKNLCMYLERYYNQKPIILIDEYDVPLQRAYLNGYYKEAINFFRGLLQDALKTNNYLELAILTGCLRISKESIFTGLNNLEINSILDKQYAEHFGFLQREVDEMIKYYELEKKREEIKEWYDGYKFGTRDIYNPWSVLKSIKDMRINEQKKPEAYWVNTSGNDIVKKLVKKADNKARDEIETLMRGGEIEKALNPNIIYNDLEEDVNNIWSMLFFTGYLTYKEEKREENEVISRYSLVIPNKELLYVYEMVIQNWFKEIVREKNFRPLFESMIKGDTETAAKEINAILRTSISTNDSAEKFYHGFMIGVLQRIDNYNIVSNRESGNGRSDILLEPIDPDIPAIIIEIKRTKLRNELIKKCDEAIKQIEEKKYEEYFTNQGYEDIVKYGMAFFKKECKIKKSDKM